MNKHRFSLFILLIAFGIMILSCADDDDITQGQFPTAPVNFEKINSEYDDYNSASPYELYNEFPLVFSSNRESQGENFNLVNFLVTYYYIESTNTVVFDVLDHGYYYYDSILLKINTPSNEFGPVMTYDYVINKEIFLYASDISGNLDLYYVTGDYVYDDFSDAVSIEKINSKYNEAYPTINKAGTKMFFCSDSTGNFDIYSVDVSPISLNNWLQTEEIPVWISTENLNSSANDKCPYINGDLMVFTSDREGGYGGFDLYYSTYANGTWSEPINFGPEINSEFDEYRPITIYANSYKNDVMIFSSNRPGGLGGFDLYYVGIPKMIL